MPPRSDEKWKTTIISIRDLMAAYEFRTERTLDGRVLLHVRRAANPKILDHKLEIVKHESNSQLHQSNRGLCLPAKSDTDVS